MSVALFVKSCHDSILFFVKEALQADPTEQQIEVLKAIDDGAERIAIKSGHGTGKTAMLSWIVLWVGLFKRDAKIPCTAPTHPQLTVLLLPEVRKWANKLPVEFKDLVQVLGDSVRFATDNVATPRTARPENPEALQGFHAEYLCWIVDEASGIEEVHFESIEGSLTGDKSLWVMTANPTRVTGFFYQAFHKNSHLWKRFTFNAEKSRNVSEKSINIKKSQYGADSDAYRVRVLGEFPKKASDSLFGIDLLELAQNREHWSDEGLEIWGFDIARFGDDKSCLARRKEKHIYKLDRKEQLNTQELAGWLAYEYKKAENKPKAIFIDTIGVGAGVFDRAMSLGLPVFEANVSNSADDDTYSNKRSEIYHKLKSELENGAKLLEDDELIGELSATSYFITDKGKVAIAKKEDIKKKLGRCPDASDAVALTYFMEVFDDLDDDDDEEVASVVKGVRI